MSYDISDDKRRTRVFRTLLDHGDHVQYSVFLCDLSDFELVHLRAFLKDCIKPALDQILILDLGKAESDLDLVLESIGQSYEPPSRVKIF